MLVHFFKSYTVYIVILTLQHTYDSCLWSH